MSQGETALAFANRASRVFAVHGFAGSALAILALSLSVVAQESTSTGTQGQLQGQPSRPSGGQTPVTGTGSQIGGPPSPGTITRGQQVPGAAKTAAATPAGKVTKKIDVTLASGSRLAHTDF